MGVDIYLFAERRCASGDWSHVEPADGSRLYDSGSRPWLFAVLAHVKNDDPRRGEPFTPVAPPRGLPADVSSEVRAAAHEWLAGEAYAHSWLGLHELSEFDWERIAIRRGVVHVPAFAAWDGTSAPKESCVWVLAPREWDLDNEAMRALVAEARAHGYPLPAPPHSLPSECPAGIPTDLHERIRTRFTTVEWRETYATTCQYSLDETMPRLRDLGPPDDVRIVFFFAGD